MEVLTAGSGGANAGKVYAGTGTITSGVPANKYAVIAIGENQTLMALWTVPAGYTAYIHQLNVSQGATTANKYTTIRLKVRNEGAEDQRPFLHTEKMLLYIKRQSTRSLQSLFQMRVRANVQVPRKCAADKSDTMETSMDPHGLASRW